MIFQRPIDQKFTICPYDESVIKSISFIDNYVRNFIRQIESSISEKSTQTID